MSVNIHVIKIITSNLADVWQIIFALCKHFRSAVICLAHALCRDTWQARCCVVIVLVLRNSGCTTVYNKSKLTVTEAHTITLHSEPPNILQLEGTGIGYKSIVKLKVLHNLCIEFLL